MQEQASQWRNFISEVENQFQTLLALSLVGEDQIQLDHIIENLGMIRTSLYTPLCIYVKVDMVIEKPEDVRVGFRLHVFHVITFSSTSKIWSSDGVSKLIKQVWMNGSYTC